jgi:hypothetical protein
MAVVQNFIRSLTNSISSYLKSASELGTWKRGKMMLMMMMMMVM